MTAGAFACWRKTPSAPGATCKPGTSRIQPGVVLTARCGAEVGFAFKGLTTEAGSTFGHGHMLVHGGGTSEAVEPPHAREGNFLPAGACEPDVFGFQSIEGTAFTAGA